MKDVIAVLGDWKWDGPIHVELVACGLEDAGRNETTDVGLNVIATALANCAPLYAESAGLVSVAVGSDEDALSLSVKIGSVRVNVLIRADAERIGDNAVLTVSEPFPSRAEMDEDEQA